MIATIKGVLIKQLRSLGYRVIKVKGTSTPRPAVKLHSMQVTDLETLAQLSSSIPGMVTVESGKFLYSLCYMQTFEGDVVEIGSWQGFSTSFLARAVKDSQNGTFYAIDHFKGNVNLEKYFVVEKQDLSDLKTNFIQNMRKVGLWEHVNLLDMSNEQAVQRLRDKKIRFLFIDGDHSKSGVEKDISLFFPLLTSGSIVVFDDFNSGENGLVEAVDNLLGSHKFSKVFSYRNTLVVMI